MIRNFRAFGRIAIAAVLTLMLAVLAVGAFGQAGGKPTFVNGEAVITVLSGTPRAAVDGIATKVNATVVKSLGRIDTANSIEAWHLKLKDILPTAQRTQAAVDALKNDIQVKGAWPNLIRRPMGQIGGGVIPNDPRWNEQWDMRQINMPLAWTLEKGAATVCVAVVDTGTDITHEDFKASRIFKPFNAVTGTTDPNPLPGSEHGTFVAGFVAAQADNGKGIAGVTFDNVLLMPINAGTDAAGFSLTDLITAYNYIFTQMQQNPSIRFIVNLSLGGGATSDVPTVLDPDEVVLVKIADNSGIVVCSAGNGFQQGNGPTSPAHLASIHNNILSVAATAESGAIASYSTQRVYNTCAAPGGDAPNGKPILGLAPTRDGSYKLIDTGGTSAAAPHVSGLCALLLSVPGVQVSEIKQTIKETCGLGIGQTGVPDTKFGSGIINSNDAILRVAVGTTILTPDGFGGKASRRTVTRQPDPVETLMPTVGLNIRLVKPADLSLTIDNKTIDITPYITNVSSSVTDPLTGAVIPTRYDIVIKDMVFSPGNHTIVVSGANTSSNPPRTDTDTRTFTVTPHVVAQGRSFISIPYFDPSITAPEQYFGNNFSLARWVPWEINLATGKLAQATGRYAFYSSFGFNDNEASFQPRSTAPHPDGTAAPAYPLGIGFWSDQEGIKPILTKGQPLTTNSFVIPLIPLPDPALVAGSGLAAVNNISWNMIGDPFPIDVPFNTLAVDTPGGRITISEAASRGLILPNIYSYNGEGYEFRTLPDGMLHPWTGYWVGVTTTQPISFVVPPLSANTRAAAVRSSRAVPGDGWKLRLTASSKNLRDSFNFIGVSSSASDGPDSFKVQKPPMMSPNVSVAIMHSDWQGRSGVFAQDIRSSSGNKTWDVVVGTDQPNVNVTFNWDQIRVLPRNVRLMLKDESNGQMVDMRSRSSVTFNTGDNAANRRFTITASQGVSAPVRISNLVVTGGRGATTNVIGFSLSGDATYAVNILSASGKPVGTVATRAAAAGDVHLVWNGKDSSGKSVPAGTYIVQVRATGPENDTVKAIVPFVLVR